MPRSTLREVPLYLLPEEWRAMQAEANRRELPPVEVLRRWIAPHLEELITPIEGRRGSNPKANCREHRNPQAGVVLLAAIAVEGSLQGVGPSQGADDGHDSTVDRAAHRGVDSAAGKGGRE